MPDEESMPDPRKRPLLLDRARKRCEPLAGAVIVVAVGAVVGGLVLVGASTRTTQGARASTRLRWEERAREIDRIASEAEAAGKLRARE